MPDKVYAVITVARQIEGEYVLIKTERAFSTVEKAQQLLPELKQKYLSPVTISTLQGDIPCMCEVGIFELTIE